MGCAFAVDAPYEELPLDVSETGRGESALLELGPGELHELQQDPPADKAQYPDLRAHIRHAFRVADLDNDPQVNCVARRFTADNILDHTAQHASCLLFYEVEEVEWCKLPMELARVPFVESGYMLEAKFEAEAGGAWQFIANTAGTYEFNIDRFHPADSSGRTGLPKWCVGALDPAGEPVAGRLLLPRLGDSAVAARLNRFWPLVARLSCELNEYGCSIDVEVIAQCAENADQVEQLINDKIAGGLGYHFGAPSADQINS